LLRANPAPEALEVAAHLHLERAPEQAARVASPRLAPIYLSPPMRSTAAAASRTCPADAESTRGRSPRRERRA
jgi:hypothetical protein